MRILVLVDGLHTGEVLDQLAGLVRLAGAELLLTYVRSGGPRAGLDMIGRRPGHRPIAPHRRAEVMAAEEAVIGEALAEAQELARRHGCAAEPLRVEGEPGHAVCELASRRQVQLVVVRVGGRDRPPFGPGSLGPVARFVTDHCASPVLLLRPASYR